MRAKRIANIIPALTARTQMGQILRRVRQNNERFVVDKRGEAQAVIISVEDYLRNFAKTPDAIAELRASSKTKGTDSLSQRVINREIKRSRRAQRAKK